MARDTSALLDRFGASLPAGLGGALGLLISNLVSNRIVEPNLSLSQNTVDNQRICETLTDFIMGYLGYLLMNWDKPFISGEIWGVAVGFTVCCWGRGIARALFLTNILKKEYQYLVGWTMASPSK